VRIIGGVGVGGGWIGGTVGDVDLLVVGRNDTVGVSGYMNSEKVGEERKSGWGCMGGF